MSEHIDSGDYTYEAPGTVLIKRADLDALRVRVAELEAALAVEEDCNYHSEYTQAVGRIRELEAWKAAVPMTALIYLFGPAATTRAGEMKASDTIVVWVNALMGEVVKVRRAG